LKLILRGELVQKDFPRAQLNQLIFEITRTRMPN